MRDGFIIYNTDGVEHDFVECVVDGEDRETVEYALNVTTRGGFTVRDTRYMNGDDA